ncbi:MAG TPA: peptidylprolyl isomerase [Acidimicrobiales bacterium]|nr:peptidylprolyl isomerase [Acidimicrobiales bacterium]
MKRLVALLIAVAAAVALVGLYLPSDAANVGSTSVTRQALDSDLSAIAGSPAFTCFLSEKRQLLSGARLPFLGAGTADAKGGVYDATFVDDWLGSMITDEVAAGVVAARRLRVTPGDLAVARAVLVRHMTQVLDQYARAAGSTVPGCGGSAQTVLSSLPGWFVAQRTRAEADQDLLDARAAGAGLSPAAVSAYFSAHRRSFDRSCLDVVVVRSRPAADKVEAALRRGVSFAAEAQAASITPSSAAAGGSVGCGIVGATFLGPVVGKLDVGGVTFPVAGGGAYWVVRLASRSTVPFGKVRTAVVTALVAAGQHRAGAWITAALRAAHVGVDPRYGTTAADQLTLVRGAAAPPAGAQVSPSANLPGLTPASA